MEPRFRCIRHALTIGLTNTWKPWQPAVPFPWTPSSPWNSKREKLTDWLGDTHICKPPHYDGWHTSVSPPLCLPSLTLSPIWPLSPGAPLIPLGPLGPCEMKGMTKLETYEMWQGTCWLKIFRSCQDTVCVCVCVCVCEWTNTHMYQNSLRNNQLLQCVPGFYKLFALTVRLWMTSNVKALIIMVSNS